MRLTCPNCDAQYEVPDDVVPTEGRDVQCSNCGQTWFQHHPDHMPDDDAVDAPTADEETAAPETPKEEERVEAKPPPPPAPTDNPGLDDLDDLPPDATRQQAPARKELDPAIADILREEAATEQAARARTSDPLESQPDLGLEESDDTSAERSEHARDRTARLRGTPEPMPEAELNAAAVSSRRDLLPDIDEINSTLRSDTDRDTNGPHAQIDAPSTTKRKRSFRSGFAVVLVILAVLALIYIYAPQIAQAVPQADPYLTAYVTWVDGLRVWLDGRVQSLLSWLSAMADRSGN